MTTVRKASEALHVERLDRLLVTHLTHLVEMLDWPCRATVAVVVVVRAAVVGAEETHGGLRVDTLLIVAEKR